MSSILDLGCGPFGKIDGSIGLDILNAPHVDVVHDLDVYPYPFDDDTFDQIEMSHIIEHILQPSKAMDEIHRMSRPDALVRIVTPHYTSQLSYGDLTHYHHFGHVTFTHLCNSGKFRLERSHIVFTDFYRVIGVSCLANWFPRRWEKYASFVLPGMYVEADLRVVKEKGETS